MHLANSAEPETAFEREADLCIISHGELEADFLPKMIADMLRR
jgi:hypothetical protein